MAAVALGLALVLVLASLSRGAIEAALKNSIRLDTGHVQVRAASYDAEKVSLAWEDLLDDPQEFAARAQALEGVVAASPVLWASGILETRDQTISVKVVGIDPLSEAYAPFREGLVAGKFLAPDDRSGLLVGQRLAHNLGLAVGGRVSLLANTADGQPDEAVFAIRGLYDTGIPYYDETTVFLPLAKAQAFTRTAGRASAIFILARHKEATETIAEALRAPGLNVLTWRDLNEIMLQASAMSASILNLMNLVVLAVVAIVIANTLLMSVFERTREMGILAALGMKGRQILLMVLLEAGMLGLAGIVLGLLVGGLSVAYFATAGLYVGAEVTSTATSAILAYGDTIYARFSLPDAASSAIAALAITLLASLYPAWLAARMEPIEALRAL